MRPELPGNRGGRLKACGIAAKYRAGSENEASGSAQLWILTNVRGDVVDREHHENVGGFCEGGEVRRSAVEMQPRIADAGDCS